MADFEDHVPLHLLDNVLANDLEYLSAEIKERLHDALRLTQFQQGILDQTVQLAVAEYSGDLHSRIAQNQTRSSGSKLGAAAASLVDQGTLHSAGSVPESREGEMWSPSVIQSYLPRSMLIPGTTYPASAIEPDLPLGLTPTIQPGQSYLGGQQNLADGSEDLFHGLSTNSYMPPFDDTPYYQ